MATHAIGGRRCHLVRKSALRGAKKSWGQRRTHLVVLGALDETFGTLELASTAVRMSVAYELASGDFSAATYDRRVTVTIDEDVTGTIVDAGTGAGTVVQEVATTDPTPSNAYVANTTDDEGNTVYEGMANLERVDVTQRMGLSPGTGRFTYDRVIDAEVGTTYSAQLGDIYWFGLCTSARSFMNERGGMYSVVAGIDVADDLQHATAYGMINCRGDDGKLYTILPHDWRSQTKTFRGVHAWALLIALCDEAGFAKVFSSAVHDLLNPPGSVEGPVGNFDLTSESVWFDDDDVDSSESYVWGLDWNDGTKVGTALLEVCEQLGIQFTAYHTGESRGMWFTTKTEGDVGYLLSGGDLDDNAVSAEWGDDLDTSVPTAVDIVGGRAIYEVSHITLDKGWDVVATAGHGDTLLYWRLTFGAWDDALEANDLYRQSTMGEVYQKVFGSSPTEVYPETFDGLPVKDMPCEEYLMTFVGRRWILPDDWDVQYEDPETGDKVTLSAWSHRLVTLPDAPAQIQAKTMRFNMKVPDGSDCELETVVQDSVSGFRVYPDDGALILATPSFDLYAGGWDYSPVVARLAFEGERYSKRFGTGSRVESFPFPWLARRYYGRYAYVMGGSTTHWTEKPLYESSGDGIQADEIAQRLASAMLNRNNIMNGGTREWKGQAGYTPYGNIQVVRTTLDANGLAQHITINQSVDWNGQATIDDIHHRVLNHSKALTKAAAAGRRESERLKKIRAAKEIARHAEGKAEANNGDGTDKTKDIEEAKNTAFVTPKGGVKFTAAANLNQGEVIALTSPNADRYFTHAPSAVAASADFTVGGCLTDVESGGTGRSCIQGACMGKVYGGDDGIDEGDSLTMDTVANKRLVAASSFDVVYAKAMATVAPYTTATIPVMLGDGWAPDVQVRLCTITSDPGTGYYSVRQIGPTGPFWTASNIRIWEAPSGAVHIDYFKGEGKDQPVLLVKDGLGVWWISAGYSTLINM